MWVVLIISENTIDSKVISKINHICLFNQRMMALYYTEDMIGILYDVMQYKEIKGSSGCRAGGTLYEKHDLWKVECYLLTF